MADLLGMDKDRIARLRSADRLVDFDPSKIWHALDIQPDCTLIDVGSGVGYVTLPFAEAFPAAKVYGCDILDGMAGLLAEDAKARGLGNIESVLMEPGAIPMPDGCADIVIMSQVHHELDDPEDLLEECRRLLRLGGTIAIIDWKESDETGRPVSARSVPEATIRNQLSVAGFQDVQRHDVYRLHCFLTARA